jgi:hypothetical protein
MNGIGDEGALDEKVPYLVVTVGEAGSNKTRI